jgi:hypothetical protein
MSTNILKYRDWVLEVDLSKTKELYKQVAVGGIESCGCGQCNYFLDIRDNIYPQEIKNLFKDLGIDIHKEIELCDYGSEEYGHVYSWWFHFVGKINEGKDCDVPMGPQTNTLDLLSVNDFFKIGFTRNISLPFFKDIKDLIQVELWAELPWDTTYLLRKETND